MPWGVLLKERLDARASTRRNSPASILVDRLILAARAMDDSDVESLVVQAEAVARLRAKA